MNEVARLKGVRIRKGAPFYLQDPRSVELKGQAFQVSIPLTGTFFNIPEGQGVAGGIFLTLPAPGAGRNFLPPPFR
jgi:hypothetical protein